MDEKKRIFSNDDLKKLIIPLIWEQMLAITVGMADTMMISNAGEAAVSGVSLIDMVNNLVISILAAMATGGAVVTSHFLGAKKKEDACKSTMQLIVSSLAITVVITVICIVLARQTISLFFGSIDEDVYRNALLYFVLSALSYPFLAVYNSSAALFRSMNMSNVTFRASVIMNIVNVVGNAIGIFVLHAGVVGVAVPSLISRALAAVILYNKLHNQSLDVHIPKEKFAFDWPVIKRIFYIGVPSGIENGIFQLGRVVVTSIIALFGTVHIAANGVANSLDSVGCITGQAMNLAFITVIGTCVGAGDEKQLKYYLKKLLIWSYVMQAACCLVTVVFVEPIVSVYGLSEATSQLSCTLVRIHNGCAIFLWPLAFTFPNALRACSDVKYTMGISILSMFVFRIGLSIVIASHMGYGAIGVWWAMVADWVFRSVCFVLRYFRGKWRKLAHFA